MSYTRLARIALAATLACGGCDDGDDGTKPKSSAEALPELRLTDETPDLLLTWIDTRGGTHTAVTIAEIPDSSRETVRVITKDAGHAHTFYVADLRLKQADGSYPVRTMPRSEWESLIAARREAYRAKHAPPAASSGPERAPDPPADAQPTAGVQAIVYGAEWCGPCHEAQRWLQRKRVPTTYYDIDRQPARAAEMKRKLQAAGKSGGSIPVIDIAGQLIIGYNPSAMDRALAKAKRAIAL